MKGLFSGRLWNIVHVSIRNYSAAQPSADKALLSKLRKQTGIPFISCKKALAKFNNDFDQAKKWLLEEAQKEGWARATKLQSRPMSQGLVAIQADGKQATMIEVNCETDFVARNEKFVSMVTKLVQECSSYFEKTAEKQLSLDKAALDAVPASDQNTLADIVALNVGNLGENMALRRGTYIKTDDGAFLASYVHPSGPGKPKSLMLGKYGAIVELHQTNTKDKPVLPLAGLGSQLCQHIVGMNPKTIGEYVPRPEGSSSNLDAGDPSQREDRIGSDDESSSSSSSSSPSADDDKLLQQEFLLDTSMSVGEFLCINGVEVTRFVRFACGEPLEGELDQ